MKHHDQSIGWKRANLHDVPLWKDYLALAACHVLVIGLVAMAIYTIQTTW
jgi:hypothetical protein